MKTQAYRIALVPFPCTMLSCLGYFIYKLRGLIDEKTLVFYHWAPGRQNADRLRYKGAVALFGRDFERSLERIVRSMSRETPTLRTIFNKARSPVKAEDFHGHHMFRRLAGHYWQDPRNILGEMEESFRNTIVHGSHFGRVDLIPGVTIDKSRGHLDSWPGEGRMYISLPLRQDPLDHESPITGWEDHPLEQAPIGRLRNRCIVIAIGGPKGSGKSTLAATMARATTNAIRTLQSQDGWQDFRLDAIYHNMDLATPTVDAIARPGKIDPAELRRIKRPWTEELALEAVRSLRAEMRPGRIIFADLPGRLTEITEILAVAADLSVVVTNDWRRIRSWVRFFNRMGKDAVARIRSRLRSNDYDSAISRYAKGRTVSGRITLLTRLIKPENEFVRPFSLILLFDILPELIDRRKEQLDAFDPDQGGPLPRKKRKRRR